MVRSQLEYAISVWNPHSKKDIEIIEKVNCTLILHRDLVTRGNRCNIYQKHVNYDLRKYFFAITKWVSLPDNVVSSTSNNMFNMTGLIILCMLRI